MYCDKQEFMTSMSIKVEKVANPLNLKFHFELNELLDLTWMLQIISSEIKLESTNDETCSIVEGRSLPNPNMASDPKLYVTYPSSCD